MVKRSEASLFKTSWHVATAAEAVAAAQFARLGFDVSVQYGANQPEYDLMVAKGDQILKISVKGSADGGWGLTQTQLSRLRNANYHGAADAWLERHKTRTIICLVQFKDVALDAMPRIYLAQSGKSGIAPEQGKLNGSTAKWALIKYHVDYCFLPESWTKTTSAVTVGRFEDWVGARFSDHVPLIVDVNPSA